MRFRYFSRAALRSANQNGLKAMLIMTKQIRFLTVPILFLALLLTRSGSARSESDDMPPNEILIELTDDDAAILFNPESDAVLRDLYGQLGNPEVKQTFSQVGESRDYSDLQIERILQKYRLRPKLRRLKLDIPVFPALNRLYTLSFANPIPNRESLLERLRQSPHIAKATPNYVAKMLAGSAASESVDWLDPYVSQWEGFEKIFEMVKPFIKPDHVKFAVELLNTRLADEPQKYGRGTDSQSLYFEGRPPLKKDACTPEDRDGRERCATDKIILRFKDGIDDANRQSVFDAVGLTVLKRLKFARYVMNVPESVGIMTALESLSRRPEISYAEPSFLMRGSNVAPNDPDYTSYNYNWAFENTGQMSGTADADIDAERGWYYNTGSKDVIVAVIDSGITATDAIYGSNGALGENDFFEAPYVSTTCTGPCLGEHWWRWMQASNLWTNDTEFSGMVTNGVGGDYDGNGYQTDYYGYDFSASSITNEPIDSNGHGTEVASVIGLRGNNGIGNTGVAWEVSLMALGVCTDVNCATYDMAYILQAVEYANEKGADIVNMSFSNSSYTADLALLINTYAGILFVTAAGNDGRDIDVTPEYPASLTSSNLIAVAATDNRDQLASLSNYGATSVDLAAPGQMIWVMYPTGWHNSSGTSLAAPFVSGVAALALSEAPNLTVPELVDAILLNVNPVAALSGKVATGGRLNLGNTMEHAAQNARESECAEGLKETNAAGWSCVADVASWCFIATAAYGSPLDHHVETFRWFRNHYLMPNAPGRAFVDFYYRHSPPMAAFIKEHESMRVLARAVLTPIAYSIEYPGAALVLAFTSGALWIAISRRGKKASGNKLANRPWPKRRVT